MSKLAEATNLKYSPIDSVEAMNNELGERVSSEAAGMTISAVESRGDRQTAAVPKPSDVFGHRKQASESARGVTPVNLPKYPGPDPRSRRAHSEAGASPYASDSKPVTGELVAVTASNHSRRVYRVDENGKKRAISQDAVMELYGKADDYQGKRPRSSSLKTQRKSAIGGGINQLNFERAGVIGTDEDSITDISAINTTIETKPEAAKSSHRLERARQVGKAAIGGAEKLVVAGAVLDKRVGAWVVQKAHNPGVQDKLAGVRQKSKDVVASANTQLEKAKAKSSALWARIHERRTELSKNTHNFGEKTTDVFNRHRFTAGVLAGVLLVGGAVMATSGSDSNEHAKDRTITGSAPQHDTNKPKAAVVPAPVKEAPPAHEVMIPVHKGDLPWDSLQSAGIPADQIMQRLDAAAKKSGLKYQWHGSGTHKWIEVDGHSDTKTVMNDLDKFIQR